MESSSLYAAKGCASFGHVVPVSIPDGPKYLCLLKLEILY